MWATYEPPLFSVGDLDLRNLGYRVAIRRPPQLARPGRIRFRSPCEANPSKRKKRKRNDGYKRLRRRLRRRRGGSGGLRGLKDVLGVNTGLVTRIKGRGRGREIGRRGRVPRCGGIGRGPGRGEPGAGRELRLEGETMANGSGRGIAAGDGMRARGDNILLTTLLYTQNHLFRHPYEVQPGVPGHMTRSHFDR